MKTSLVTLFAASTVLLGACSGNGITCKNVLCSTTDTEAIHGAAVRQNMEVHIAKDVAVHPSSAPSFSGEKAAKAIDRYNKGEVTALEKVNVSEIEIGED